MTTDQVAVVEWPAALLPPSLPKFSHVELSDDGSTWTLPFPVRPGQTSAPAAVQQAWVGDIMISLDLRGITPTLHLPAGWR